MRKIFAVMTALVAAALVAVGLSGTASAAGNNTADTLNIDRTVVRAGESVHVWGEAGPETFNWVGSSAFVTRENDPYPGDGGSADVTVDENGHYDGYAVIRDVEPGEYHVTARIGGGNAGNVTITVVK
jgi:hypothetical protein